jgi:hypothetical protein
MICITKKPYDDSIKGVVNNRNIFESGIKREPLNLPVYSTGVVNDWNIIESG